MITGGTGEGKIVADTQTLAARMIRWLRGTFRFQL
jgi:hypothetical protein